MTHLEALPMRFHPRFTSLFITPDGCVLRNGISQVKQSNQSGYRKIHVRGVGNVAVHRLVADVYCEKADGQNEVNHKDGNRSNNNVSNLEWCTHLENMRHAFRSGLNPRRFSPADVYQIRLSHANGEEPRLIAARFGISLRSVDDVVKGQSYRDAFGPVANMPGRGSYGGDAHHSARTTEVTRKQIAERAAAGESRVLIARDFGVSLRCVYRIIKKEKPV